MPLSVCAEASKIMQPSPSVSLGIWQSLASMPGSNHDIMAAVLRGRIYIAGGFTRTWGEPPHPHAYDELWCYDLAGDRWLAVARFTRPRIFCATVCFQGCIWIIGGDIAAVDGKRAATTKVECFDPTTGNLAEGPALPYPQPAPLAVVARGRLYVLGQADPTKPGRMDSIGAGERTWRHETDGPLGMNAISGAEYDGDIYVCVPGTGLARFQSASGRWQIIGGPTKPRSPQVVRWRDELWIMGGRDLTDGSAIQIYRPSIGAWRLGPRMPCPLSWGASVVIDEQIYLFGGAAGAGSAGDPYRFSDRTYRCQPGVSD